MNHLPNSFGQNVAKFFISSHSIYVYVCIYLCIIAFVYLTEKKKTPQGRCLAFYRNTQRHTYRIHSHSERSSVLDYFMCVFPVWNVLIYLCTISFFFESFYYVFMVHKDDWWSEQILVQIPTLSTCRSFGQRNRRTESLRTGVHSNIFCVWSPTFIVTLAESWSRYPQLP